MNEENLIKAMEFSAYVKKALSIAVNVGCGFEGDAEDAAKLLSLITYHESRIAELEAAQRWHVVADGDLPDTYKPVLTVDMSEATRIPVPAFYNLDTKCWFTHFEYDLWVTHWMPLSELPERENER